MRAKVYRPVAVLVAVVFLAISARYSQGQITGVLDSDVEGFFGTTNDTFQSTETPNNSIPPSWTPVSSTPAPTLTPAPPYAPSGLPNIPALYAGYPNPDVPLTQNIGFQAPAGHAPGSPFTDGTTAADYHIYGGYFGAGAYTRNAFAVLGNNTANLMWLNQPPTATGYAYEDVEFAIEDSVGINGLMAGAPGPRPYLVYGNFLTPGFAEFGADVNYWWVSYIPGTTVLNPPVLLGSLQYQDYISSLGGPFLNLVPDTYSSPFLNGVSSPAYGYLELTGDMYLIGDPVDINVESVPEPGSLALLGVGILAGVAWLATRRRKWSPQSD